MAATELKGYMGTVSFDGNTVTITKKARGAQAIPVSAIASIGIEPAGLGMKGIRFSVAGGTLQGAVRPVGSHKNLAQDPFALTFKSRRASEFEEFAAQVRAATQPDA